MRGRMEKNISSIVAMITPGIIKLLMENRGLGVNAASDILYNSQLYEALEDEGTKVWRLSYYLLYDLLEEELSTGKVKNLRQSRRLDFVNRSKRLKCGPPKGGLVDTTP
jgi:hypothetical protein